MPQLMRVLTDISEEDVKRLKNERGKVISELSDCLHADILEEMPDIVVDFLDPDICIDSESDDCIFGCEQKDKLLNEVKGWNESFRDDCVFLLDICKKKAKSRGLSFDEMLRTADIDELTKMFDLYCFVDALSAFIQKK